MGNRRGLGLIDTMLALFLIAAAGAIFSATIPAGIRAVRQGGETRKATAIAQRKLEQAKSLGYDLLSYSTLATAGVIDQTTTEHGYSFTSVDDLSSVLTSPEGELVVSDYDTGIRKVTATVTWNRGGIERNVSLCTLVADRKPRSG